MTWNDLVRKYIPNATDEECKYILMERTAFPLASVETVENQIKDYATTNA
jgi:hypothetical protein